MRFRLLICVLAAWLLGITALLAWRFVYPPMHTEFAEALFKQRFEYEDRATVMRYHAGSKRLLIGMESGALHIWDATQKGARQKIKAHEYRVSNLQFSSDGSEFFSSSYFDNSTRVWHSQTGELLATIADTRGPIAPAPKQGLFVVDHGGSFAFYDLANRQLLPQKFKIDGSVTSIATNLRTGLMAFGTASGTIELWQFEDLNGNVGAHRLLQSKSYEIANWVIALQFNEDGTTLTSATRNAQVDVWDTKLLHKLRSLPTTLKLVQQASFAEDAPWLVLDGTLDPRGLKDGKAELVNLETGVAQRFRAYGNLSASTYIAALNMGLIAHGRRVTGAQVE